MRGLAKPIGRGEPSSDIEEWSLNLKSAEASSAVAVVRQLIISSNNEDKKLFIFLLYSKFSCMQSERAWLM